MFQSYLSPAQSAMNVSAQTDQANNWTCNWLNLYGLFYRDSEPNFPA
jgi:hypothetical protein